MKTVDVKAQRAKLVCTACNKAVFYVHIECVRNMRYCWDATFQRNFIDMHAVLCFLYK